jgi:hypothetical protein
MGETALVVGALIAAVGSGVAAQQNAQAAKAERKGAKKTNLINQQRAEIENQRNARRAIAARRVQQAELIASAQPGQVGANSALSGAVGSLTTQTGANIGFASTMLAGQNAANNTQLKYQNRASKFRVNAAWGGLVSDIGTSMMSYGASTGGKK